MTGALLLCRGFKRAKSTVARIIQRMLLLVQTTALNRTREFLRESSPQKQKIQSLSARPCTEWVVAVSGALRPNGVAASSKTSERKQNYSIQLVQVPGGPWDPALIWSTLFAPAGLEPEHPLQTAALTPLARQLQRGFHLQKGFK